MNYEEFYYPLQHFVTTPQLDKRRRCFGNQHIMKLLKKQDPTHDLYISKYATDGIVTCIILDFDSKEDQQKAKEDAMKLKRFLKTKGLNTVIVRSGNKGYHTYTQITMRKFKGKSIEMDEQHYKAFFEAFVKELIGLNLPKPLTYPTLDSTNTNAGLGGNIRLIGSIHPKTGERCRIIDGEFVDMDSEEWDHITQWEHDCYSAARKYAIINKEHIEKKEREAQTKLMSKYGYDPCAVNDLRQLMPRIYGGKVKEFDGYITMQCPFHDDNNPSMMVTNVWFSCAACGEKGNWWTLRDKGVVDFKEETIRVKK